MVKVRGDFCLFRSPGISLDGARRKPNTEREKKNSLRCYKLNVLPLDIWTEAKWTWAQNWYMCMNNASNIYTMEIWCLVYIFDGWYVRNNWCWTNPKLVLHTPTLSLSRSRFSHTFTQKSICTLSTTQSFVCCACSFYRPWQAHKLSKLNWIPFILMLHYRNYSDKASKIKTGRAEWRESERRSRSENKTIKAFPLLSFHTLHGLPSNE